MNDGPQMRPLHSVMVQSGCQLRPRAIGESMTTRFYVAFAALYKRLWRGRLYVKRTLTSLLTPGSSMVTP